MHVHSHVKAFMTLIKIISKKLRDCCRDFLRAYSFSFEDYFAHFLCALPCEDKPGVIEATHRAPKQYPDVVLTFRFSVAKR